MPAGERVELVVYWSGWTGLLHLSAGVWIGSVGVVLSKFGPKHSILACAEARMGWGP